MPVSWGCLGGVFGDQTGVSSSASGLGLLRTAPPPSYGWKWGKGGFKVAHRVSVCVSHVSAWPNGGVFQCADGGGGPGKVCSWQVSDSVWGRGSQLEFQPQMGMFILILPPRRQRRAGTRGPLSCCSLTAGAGMPACPATQNPGQPLGDWRLGAFLWSLPCSPTWASLPHPPHPSPCPGSGFHFLKKSPGVSHDPSESPGGWQSHGQAGAPTGRRPGEGGISGEKQTAWSPPGAAPWIGGSAEFAGPW